MIDFKPIEHNIINHIKPKLIYDYLALNQLRILPKEISWYIIENEFNINEHIQNLEYDKNIVKIWELYSIKLISMVSKESLIIKVSPKLDEITNRLIHYAIYKNFPYLIDPISDFEEDITLFKVIASDKIIIDQLYNQYKKEHPVFNTLNSYTNQMLTLKTKMFI